MFRYLTNRANGTPNISELTSVFAHVAMCVAVVCVAALRAKAVAEERVRFRRRIVYVCEVARRYMDEDGQAENRKIVSSPGMAKLHATPSFSSAATCRSAPFVTLPKFRSRLIQLSPPGAAASSSAE